MSNSSVTRERPKQKETTPSRAAQSNAKQSQTAQGQTKSRPKLAIKTLLAPVSGQSAPLEQYPDLLINNGLLGRGVSITPQSSRVVAPSRVKVINIAATQHHLTLAGANGIIIEIIVGADAISTHGLGFCAKVAIGDIVEAGALLLELDLIKLKSLLTAVEIAVIVSKGALKVTPKLGNLSAGVDEIMQIVVKEEPGR